MCGGWWLRGWDFERMVACEIGFERFVTAR